MITINIPTLILILLVLGGLWIYLGYQIFGKEDKNGTHKQRVMQRG